MPAAVSFVALTRKLLLAAAACVALSLAGCATLPDEGPRAASTSLPVQGPATPLDRIATASMEGQSPEPAAFA